MIWKVVDGWLQDMADKYPYLEVREFGEQFFLEDNLGHYIGIVPLINSRYGTVPVTNSDALVTLSPRFYVIWRLPEITEDVVRACIVETLILGRVDSVTTDIRHIYNILFTPGSIPPDDINFVAVEVVPTITFTIRKDSCNCLHTLCSPSSSE